MAALLELAVAEGSLPSPTVLVEAVLEVEPVAESEVVPEVVLEAAEELAALESSTTEGRF